MQASGQRATSLAALLVRPGRSSDEGSLEFGLRLSWANGLSDVRWLVNEAQHRALRYCPLCLLESAHWHSAWNDGGRPCCTLHQIWLCEQCHVCGHALRLNRVRLVRCSCGADLREAPVNPMGAAYRACDSADDPPTQATLLWLGSWSVHGPKGKPLKKASVTGLTNRVALLEAGAEVVQGWPDAWFTALGRHRRRVDAGQVQRVNEAWPGLPTQIRRLPDPAWRDRVWVATDAFVGRSLGTSRPLVGRNPRIHRYAQTQKAAADALGIGVARLQSMLTEGGSAAENDDASVKERLGLGTTSGATEAAAAPERRTVGGRVRRVIAPPLVAALAQALNALVSVQRAAEILGCGRGRVLALIDAGVLCRVRAEVRRADVEALRNRVLGLAENGGLGVEQPRGWRSLDEIWRLLIPVSFTQEFMLAVQEGRIRVWAAPGATNLRGVFVPTPEVQAWWRSEQARGHETLSLGQAAVALGVKEQVAYALADRGLLKASATRIGRRAGRRVTLESISAFQDRYVALTTLTAPEGVHSHAALAWAQARGLKVVTGPKVDGSRQYFVERIS